jgi:hypothetical protein
MAQVEIHVAGCLKSEKQKESCIRKCFINQEISVDIFKR